jgi:hypothetical protein
MAAVAEVRAEPLMFQQFRPTFSVAQRMGFYIIQ